MILLVLVPVLDLVLVLVLLLVVRMGVVFIQRKFTKESHLSHPFTATDRAAQP